MGTPGDKAEIGKVVRSEAAQSQLDPEQGVSTPRTTTATTTSTTATSTASYAAPPQQFQLQPSTSSTDIGGGTVVTGTVSPAEMGYVGQQPTRLPQFETFAAVRTALPSTAGTASKPESFQASLEDYFAQTKYYPSSSEGLQSSLQYPLLPTRTKAVSRGPDEAGPSGLQVPRTKPTAKLKRTKRAPPQSASTSATPSTSAAQQQHLKKTHSCQICHKNFVSAEKLSKHQQVHSGASPFKCDHCKKSFSSKFKLVRHALIHSDRKPFQCTVCERTFHRKDHLKNHIKVHSPSKKVYSCERPDCKKEYTSLMSFRKHRALHAAEEGSLQCQICQSVFATREEILYHLKVHAGSRTVKNPSEKKFTCDQCDRKFFTKKDVRRHLVVHTGIRDFLCQFCPQRFGRKDHLVRHIKKAHSRNVPPEELETAIKRETAGPGGASPERLPETITSGAVAIKEEVELFEIKTELEAEEAGILPIGGELIAAVSAASVSAATEQPFGFSLEDVDVSNILQELPPLFEQPEGELIELRDLGGGVLEGIESGDNGNGNGNGGNGGGVAGDVVCPVGGVGGDVGAMGADAAAAAAAVLPPPVAEVVVGQPMFSSPELQRLLEPSEDKNLPLPGFSQTFQSPPPPPPP